MMNATIRHRKSWSLIVCLFLCFCLQRATGQTEPKVPWVRIQLGPQLLGLEVIYISHMDITNRGSSEYFFDLEIYDVEQDWENTTLIIEWIQGDESIVTLESEPFTLPAPDPLPPQGSPSYTASNLDLLNTGIIPGTTILLNFSRSFNPPTDEFEQDVLQSGKLVRGSYNLVARLINPAWNVIVEHNTPLNITNPSLIQLQQPQNEEVVFTEFPFFHFESDASNFIVSMYKRINPHDDVETILSGHPTMEFETMFERFSYHITGGEPLESGATYFWVVRALVQTTKGVEEFQSDVWQFTIDTEGLEFSDVDIQQLLEPFLGQLAKDIADLLRNYDLKQIKINGQSITLQDFFQYLNDLMGGEFEIQDLVIE